MSKSKNSRRWFRWLFFVLFFLVILWFFFSYNGIEWIGLRILPGLSENRKFRSELKREKSDLVRQLDKIQSEHRQNQIEISILREELRSLKEEVHVGEIWKDYPNIKGEPARIFFRDPYGLYSSFLIDKGSNENIREDMAVLGESSVIGRIVEVHPTFSRVRTIRSPNLAFGAIVKRTKELGVLVGGRKELSLTYLTINSDVVPGDEIVTSGTTDMTPGGLLIGKVKEVIRKETGEEMVVHVISNENIETLNSVWVITTMKIIPEGASLKEKEN